MKAAYVGCYAAFALLFGGCLVVLLLDSRTLARLKQRHRRRVQRQRQQQQHHQQQHQQQHQRQHQRQIPSPPHQPQPRQPLLAGGDYGDENGDPPMLPTLTAAAAAGGGASAVVAPLDAQIPRRKGFRLRVQVLLPLPCSTRHALPPLTAVLISLLPTHYVLLPLLLPSTCVCPFWCPPRCPTPPGYRLAARAQVLASFFGLRCVFHVLFVGSYLDDRAGCSIDAFSANHGGTSVLLLMLLVMMVDGQALATCLLFGFQPELTAPLFARLAALRDGLFAATLGRCPCTRTGGPQAAAVVHESLNSAQRVRVTPS